MEHYRQDTYQPIDETRAEVRVPCSCGWRSRAVAPDRCVPVGDRTASGGLLSDLGADQLEDLWREHIAPLVDPDPGQVLILSDDGGGPRHFLAGEALHNGAPLELQLPDGTWWRGRYETTRRDGAMVPLFYGRLGGPASEHGAWEYVPQVSFELPPRAVLRRPTTR